MTCTAAAMIAVAQGCAVKGAPPRAAGRQAMERLGVGGGEENAPADPAVILEVITRLAALDGPPVGLVVDFASRLVVRTEAMSESEQRLFANALVQSHRARPRPAGARTPAFNTVIWVVEREGSLPDWPDHRQSAPATYSSCQAG